MSGPGLVPCFTRPLTRSSRVFRGTSKATAAVYTAVPCETALLKPYPLPATACPSCLETFSTTWVELQEYHITTDRNEIKNRQLCCLYSDNSHISQNALAKVLVYMHFMMYPEDPPTQPPFSLVFPKIHLKGMYTPSPGLHPTPKNKCLAHS